MHTVSFSVPRDGLITHYRHQLAWHAYVGVVIRFYIVIGTEKYLERFFRKQEKYKSLKISIHVDVI